MSNDQLTEYRRSQVMGMSQVELIVMLYSGAIRFINEAIEHMENGRYDQSWQKFDRARKIVIHMLGTLNFEAGDLAGKFASLYAFVIEQIGVANARRDTDIARQCIDVLATLKEGWDGVVSQEDSAVAASAAAQPATPATPTNRPPLCVNA
jgi:flagellar protein FliS